MPKKAPKKPATRKPKGTAKKAATKKPIRKVGGMTVRGNKRYGRKP